MPAPQFLPTTMRPLSADPPPAALSKSTEAGASKGESKTKPKIEQEKAAPVQEQLLRQDEKDIHETYSDQQRMGIKGVVSDNAVQDMLDPNLSSKFKSILKDIEQYGHMNVTAASAKKVLEESKLLYKIGQNLAKHLDSIKRKPESKEYRLTKMYLDYFSLSANGYLQIPEQASDTVKKIGYPKAVSVNVTHEKGHREKTRRLKMRSARDESLFPHEPSVNDIRQGSIGDCYLLAGLASMAHINPQMIKDCMKDNLDGTVTVRFYKKNEAKPAAGTEPEKPGFIETQYVRVEKSVPQDNDFAKGSLWVQMIEKAYTASGLHNNIGKKAGFEPSYQDIVAGDAWDFLFTLTGREHKKILNSDMPGNRYMVSLYESLIDRYAAEMTDDPILADVDHNSVDIIAPMLAFRRHILGDETPVTDAYALLLDADLSARINAVRNCMREIKTEVDAVTGGKEYVSDALRQEEFLKILDSFTLSNLPDNLFTAAQKEAIKERIREGFLDLKAFSTVYQSFSGRYSEEAINTYNGMEAALKRGEMVTCSTFAYAPEKTEGGGLNNEVLARGIAQRHAYTVLGVETRGSVMLVKLRNPWGGGALAYSQNEGSSAINRDMNYESEGIFVMELNDFMAAFGKVSAN